jgi:hypothetical protein
MAEQLRGPFEKLVDPPLLQVRTLWRCGDGLLSEVLPLASDVLLTTHHSLLENVKKNKVFLLALSHPLPGQTDKYLEKRYSG